MANKIKKSYGIMRNGTHQGNVQAYTIAEARNKVFAQYGKHFEVFLDEEEDVEIPKTKFQTKLEVLRLEMIDEITSHIKKNGAIEIVETEQRHCSKCSKPMDEGYCIGGGQSYYCTERCLNKALTKSEIEDLQIGADDSDSYWTDWKSVISEQEIEEDQLDNLYYVMQECGDYEVMFNMLSIHFTKNTLVFNCYDKVSNVFRSFNCTYGYVSTDMLAEICDSFIK